MKSLRNQILERLSDIDENEIDETLHLKHGMKNVGKNAKKAIHDFVHSKDKRFKGKSKKERIRMALGAAYGAARNESIEPKVGSFAVYEGNIVKIKSLTEGGMAVIQFANRRDPIIVRKVDLKIPEKNNLNESFFGMAQIPSTYREPVSYGFPKLETLKPEDIGLIFEDDDTGEKDEQEEEHDNGSNVRHDGHTGKTEVDALPTPSDTISPAYTDKKPPKKISEPLSTHVGAEESHLWDEPNWDGYDYPADSPEIPVAEYPEDIMGNSREPKNGHINEDEKWIQKTGVNKPGHKGRLHRALGVPEDKPIPKKKLKAALHSKDPHIRHMAQFAHNVNEDTNTDGPKVEVDTITLPSSWASALVNGDFSGLDDQEQDECMMMIDKLAKQGWEVVDVARDENGEAEEPRFTWNYQIYNPNSQYRGGEVLEYVIHKRNTPLKQMKQPKKMGESASRKHNITDLSRNKKKEKQEITSMKKDLEFNESYWLREMDDLLNQDEEREPKSGDNITMTLPAMASVLVTVLHRRPNETIIKSMIEALAEVGHNNIIDIDDLDAVAAHMNGEETHEIENRENGLPDHYGMENYHPPKWPGDGKKTEQGKTQLMGGDMDECNTKMSESLWYNANDIYEMTDDEELELIKNRAFPNRRFK
jgi:hypothetical protein